MLSTVKFWRGNVLPDPTDANTLYFINPSGTELGKLYLGNTPIANWVDLNGVLNDIQELQDELFSDTSASSRIDVIENYITNNEEAWSTDTNTEYSADESTLTLDNNNTFSIKDGGVSRAKLNAVIQNSLDKANTAVQPEDLDDLNAGVKSVVDGDDNGTIKVDNVPITVYDDSELVEKANSNTTKIETLYTYGTQDMVPGETPLETGKFYFVYEALEGDVIEGDTISFTINGTTYQATSGMTWANWVGSDYNTGGFLLAGSGVYHGESAVCTSQTKDTAVLSSGSITPNYAYYLVAVAGKV